MDTIRGFFFPKSEYFFQLSKKARGGLSYSPLAAHLWLWLNMHHSPLVAHLWVGLNMHECPWISLNILNIPDFPWKCLNKLSWLFQGIEHAWSSCMFHILLKMDQVLNQPGFWIWHGCIHKGYAEFWIYLNLDQYASIMPEYTSICLQLMSHGFIEKEWGVLEVVLPGGGKSLPWGKVYLGARVRVETVQINYKVNL